MAITKRTRFEVLRRDNYTCRYCRSSSNELHVDHVTPVALGGTDTPENLVAACKDCSLGKASTSPDDGTVAEVREDAIRYAELTRQAYAILVETIGERDDYAETFEESYQYGLPEDWKNSLGRWFDVGVPLEIVLEASEIACRKQKAFRGTDRFSYFCGIVWNQVQLVGEQVAQKSALDGAWLTDEELTNQRIDAYMQGLHASQKAQESDGT